MIKETKIIGRRLFGLALALALVLTMLPSGLTASAASTIDTTASGSLTIYKYAGEEQESEEARETAIANGELEPLEGVVFSYLYVGGVSQGTNSNGAITIGYSITNQPLLSRLNSTNQLEIAFTEGGTTYYTSASLNTALNALASNAFDRSDLETIIANQSETVQMTATNANGMTRASNLSVGLYLVVETSYPISVTTSTAPFFVSIPMMLETDDGYEWEYNVVAYPKNSTGSGDISIEKSVVEDGNEAKQIDAEIGQDKQFVIRASLPAAIANMQTYTITDTLSSGLTFQSSSTPVVRAINESGATQTLTLNTHYRLSQSGQTLTVQFICSAMGGYTQVEISYYAYLNANATVGGTGNSNGVELRYSTSTDVNSATTTTSPSELPAIYTYAFNVQKQFDGTSSGNFSEVTFELYRESVSEANRIAVSYNSTSGRWYVAGNTSTGNPNYTLTLDTSGGLFVYGLEAGTYYLVETGTADGYSLLSDPIAIVINSNEGSYYTSANGTFAQYIAGSNYYADATGSTQFILPAGVAAGDWVNFGSSTVYRGTSPTSLTLVEMNQPESLQWTVSVAGNQVVGSSSSFAAIGNGTFEFTVDNQTSGFELPRTGGSGTFWFLVVGGVVVAAAIAVIVVVTRKKKDGTQVD